MSTHESLVVFGEDALAERIIERCRDQARGVRQVGELTQAAKAARTVNTLVMIAPEQPGDALSAIDQAVARRSSRLAPLRLILVQDGDEAADIPPDGLSPHLRLEPYRLPERAARALLAGRPLHMGFDARFGQRPHLLFLGLSTPGDALLAQALRLVHYGDERALVSIAVDDPERARRALERHSPEAQQVAELRWCRPDALGLEGTPAVTSAYACVERDALPQARRLAEEIRARQGRSPLIHCEVGEQPIGGQVDDWDGQLVPFSYLELATRPAHLLDGVDDALASAIHNHYRDNIAAQGRDPDAEPGSQPWAQLAETYRDASRHQADHFAAKLAITDCRAIHEDEVETFAFAPLEVENMAVIEHARWAADRYLDGWRYAPVRDNSRKHHPQLIPYDNLSGPMKDLDRFAVRLAPSLLARAGLGVVRSLLVAVESSASQLRHGRLLKLTEQLLERLVQRYPDRGLVLASDLATPAARLVVREAVERAGASLFLLSPHPIGDVLAAQPNEQARAELKTLAARAERRIGLDGTAEMARWMDERAEIRVCIDLAGASSAPGKRVDLDSGSGRAAWSFEY